MPTKAMLEEELRDMRETLLMCLGSALKGAPEPWLPASFRSDPAKACEDVVAYSHRYFEKYPQTKGAA